MAAPLSESKNNTNEQHEFTNALIHEKSPYLLQHAHNPVNWYPWGDEALNKAKKENKLIFLSVGYSTCHWCHVMERESFENNTIAKILNDNFICIKVDREERPDIDKIYMNYVTAITQHGGWPMSVFLSPTKLYPIYGGTYYPSEHFIDILQRLNELWTNNSNDLELKSNQIINVLKNSIIKTEIDNNISDCNKIFEQTYEIFKKRFDNRRGGFGSAPKFPRPVEINFLLNYYYYNKHNSKGKDALKMCLKTLDAMGNGGMYDHLGGGFHRYSVDEYFHVPHFEKMLYDNAQLINTYLSAYQITKNTFYKNIAEETLNYILRDMKMLNGGIYSAEDADSLMDNMKEKKEGAFYIWTEKEFDKLLTNDEAIILKELYMISTNGNTNLSMRSDPQREFVGYNVLYKKSNDLIGILNKVKKQSENVETLKDIETAIINGNKKLFEYRAQRARPHLDNKIICAWNGLVLSSFANAYKILKKDIYLKTAKEIAQFMFDNMRNVDNGYLYRIYGKNDIYAFSVDYSFLIYGLLDLYECCGEYKWLEWLIQLQNIQNTLFFDDKFGAYFDTVKDSQNLIMRLKEEYDGAEPCSSSIAVGNLVKLYNITKDEKYLKIYANKTLKYLNNTLDKMPYAIPQTCIGLSNYTNGLKQIVITSIDNKNTVGNKLFSDNNVDDEKDDQKKYEQRNNFLNVLYENYYPNTVCIVLNENNYYQMKDAINELYEFYTMDKNNNVMAHVCKQFMCQKPTNDLNEFKKQLENGNAGSDNDENEIKTN